MLEDFGTPGVSGRLGGGVRPGEVLRSGQQRLGARGWGTDYPLQPPDKVRLFNARQGDPRRQVGQLLSDEDLRHKKQVDQAVWGKQSYLWRDIDAFDPFREGEIRALRRGEIVGFMDERPNSCEIEVNLFTKRGATGSWNYDDPGVTCNHDEDCIILQGCQQDRECPIEQQCVPYCENKRIDGTCTTGWAQNFTTTLHSGFLRGLDDLLEIEGNSKKSMRCKEKCGTKDAVYVPSFDPVQSSTDHLYVPARQAGPDTKVCSGRRTMGCETADLMTEKYGSPAVDIGRGVCRPVYCLTGHDTNLYTRYGERSESDKSVYNETGAFSIYDDLDQAAGTLEMPGAGVDYHRDDIIRQIRYAELKGTKVDPQTGQRLFELIVNKCTNDALDPMGRQENPYGHPRCEVQTEHEASAGETSPRTDVIVENIEAHRVFQLWASPHQATLQADEDGKIRLFDAHEDTVVYCDTVMQLLATQNRSEDRLHILLRAGREYVLHRPLNFTSTRVHISGYQNYTKMLMPIGAVASSAYSSYTMPTNLVSGSGLLSREQVCEDTCLPNPDSAHKGSGSRRKLTGPSGLTLGPHNLEGTGRWPMDGVCDDGGEGSYYDSCMLGTDCSDCGPRFVINKDTDAGNAMRGVSKDDVGMNKGMEGDPLPNEGGGSSSREIERAMGHGMIERHDGHDQSRTHDNQFSSGTMWQSAWGTVKNQWVSFDLGPHLVTLDGGKKVDVGHELVSAFVWNFNQDRVARPRSVRTMFILAAGPQGGSAIGPMAGGSFSGAASGAGMHMSFGDLAPGVGYTGRVRLRTDPETSLQYYATDGEFAQSGYRRSGSGADGGESVTRLSTDMILPTCESMDPIACPQACTAVGMEECLKKRRLDTFFLHAGTGELDLPPQRIELTGPNTKGTRYVRFITDNAYGNRMQQYVGLSEVRFGVKDPESPTYLPRAKITTGHNGRIATVPPHFALKFSDVWLSHGVTDGTGGIVVDGTLILYNVTLESNVSYSWDGGSWRAGGVAIYNRGSTYMDLCDLVWDAQGTSTPPGHPTHKFHTASQGSTSFIGLLARRTGLVRATGGMIYNALSNDRDPTHHFSNGQSYNRSYEEGLFEDEGEGYLGKRPYNTSTGDYWETDDDYAIDGDGDLLTAAPTSAPSAAPTATPTVARRLMEEQSTGAGVKLRETKSPEGVSGKKKRRRRRRRKLEQRAHEQPGLSVHGNVDIDMHHNHPMPVPTKWQQYDANLTIDQCKFEGDQLSTRMWDSLGEQSPWWCTIDPHTSIGGNTYLPRSGLMPGVSTGVVDGSEGPPLGSHRDVGGGSEGMLPGGPSGGVKKWSYPAEWANELKHNFRWDIGGHYRNSTGGWLLRLCRVVDGDSVVLCENNALHSGREVAIRLTGVAIPETRNCRVYASDVVEKAFDSDQPVNENMGCSDAVMKKRAELAARFIDQFIGAQVKLELLQRWSNHGENVGRVTLVSELPKLPDRLQSDGFNKDYRGASLGEELVRHGYLVRIYQSII